MRHKGLLSITLFLFLVNSCAYYNTFYNAKTSYNNAIRAKKNSPTNKAPSDLLDKVIEKCGKVIKYYPKSKWLDDAIILMGKAYLEKGEYDKAVRKFQELSIYYPESPFTPEALYLTGVTYLEKEDYNLAIISFHQVLNLAKGEFLDDASYGIVKAYSEKKDSSLLLSSGKMFSQNFSKSPYLPRVLLLLSNNYIENGNYDNAIETLKKARSSARKGEDKTGIEEKYAVTLIKMGKIDEGLSILKGLSEKTSLPERTSNLIFEITDAYIKSGKTKEALTELDNLISLYSTGPFIAEAFYRKGLVYENTLNDIESAITAYENALKLAATQDIRIKTTKRNNTCKEIKTYRERIENPDSTTDLAKTHFLLAESFLFGKSFIDSALNQYQQVLNTFPKNSLAPKSAMAIGWLYETEKRDTSKALTMYEFLMEKYPNTEYSEAASIAISKLKEKTEIDKKYDEKNKGF